MSFLLVIERLERTIYATARETGVSKEDGRAENWEEKREKKETICFVLPPHSPRGCASRSLQSLNYCGRETKGTACSLGRGGNLKN